MVRRIRPFDDSQQKDRRRSTTNPSTNTSAIDPYRQGVELTNPVHFANGIAKIHDGYNDQTGQHGVPDLVLGQSRPILRDDNSYLEMAKFNPVARFDDPPDLTSGPTTVPTITSLNYSLGDIAGGGASIILTGSGFIGVGSVKFGTTNASFVIDSDSQITATLPAHAAGSVSVTAVNDVGASNGISFEYWSPAQLTPKAWSRGPNYTSGGGASGVFTDSGSLADNFVQVVAGLIPAEGNVSLRPPVPQFDGSDDFLSNTTAWSTAVGASFFIWVLFFANTAVTDPVTYHGNLLGDTSNAEVGVDIGASGFSATILEGAAVYQSSGYVPCSTGAWHLGLLQCDAAATGAEGMVAVDNGAWTTFAVAGGYGPAAAGVITLGKGYEARYLDGYEADVGIVDGTVSAGNITKLRLYCNQRYGVSV